MKELMIVDTLTVVNMIAIGMNKESIVIQKQSILRARSMRITNRKESIRDLRLILRVLPLLHVLPQDAVEVETKDTTTKIDMKKSHIRTIHMKETDKLKM